MTTASLHTRRFWFWAVVTALLVLFVYAIKAILLPFVIGMMLAYVLDPAADRLEKYGLSRGVATAGIMIGFFSVLGVALAVLMPMLYKQTMGLITSLPVYIEDAQHLFTVQFNQLMGQLTPQQSASAKEAVDQASSEVFDAFAGFIAKLMRSGSTLINLVSLLVITPVVSFYLLRDWDKFTACAFHLLPRQHEETIRGQISLIDETLAGFLRGTVNVMLILGSFYAIALSLAGLKFALIIGLMGGVLILIPYLGTIITGLSAVGIAYMQQEGMEHVAIVAAIFITGQMLEGYVLTPKLVGERVGLHPLWLIFGMLAGATLFGFVGVFLAVPVTAVIGVLVRFALDRYLESPYYQPITGQS